MRDYLKALDHLEMGDHWHRVRGRAPTPEGPEPRRPLKTRTVTYVLSAAALAVVVFVIASLRPLGGESNAPASVGSSPTQSPSATPPIEAGTVPATLVLHCGSGGATDISPQIEAAADGVHLRMISTAGSPEVMFKGEQGLTVVIDGTRATLVLPIPPGEHGVRCIFDKADRKRDFVPFEVVDPIGYWVNPALDCPGKSTEVEYTNNEVLHVHGDPYDEMKAFAEAQLAGRFPESGAVTSVGYPRAERPSFGYVTSSGSVLGIVGFSRGASPGDWLPESYQACTF